MTSVRLERDADIAVIVIDNPPINAGSTEVRRCLLQGIETIATDPSVTAAVIIGAGRTFMAGSDIREFGKPLAAPELPQVIAAIERCPKPFVAALAGAALGGGYELALGCDARIAEPGTVVGLPEVTLGMIPGAGDQRLPRLVGAAKALDLICTGTRVEATEALALGMIDAVADGPLRAAAIDLARSLDGRKQHIIDRPVPWGEPALLEAAEARALHRGRARPPVIAAIAAVRSAIDQPSVQALAAEREAFTQLRLAPEAAALRHLFFAERRASRGPKDAQASTLTSATVIGAGTMGAGIAAALLQAGLSVTLIDNNAAAVQLGEKAIEASIARWRASGKLDADRADTVRTRLRTSSDLAQVQGSDIAIEAIAENMAAKTALLEQLNAILPADAIIASNTSYLDIEALGQVTDHPERFIGLHFFNPATVMRLVEVVCTRLTSDTTLATGLALVRQMAKQAVVARAGPGFIGNRIYAAYRRQCEFMLEDGAWPEQIDAALEGFGFALGPFATGDLSGLDIAWAMRKAQAATRDPSYRYVAISDRLCEAGRLGRKAGKGWYAYPEGSKSGVPDPEVGALIQQESAAKGITRRHFDDAEIVDNVLATMINEAALLVEEGVARHASDIDVVFVHGYGFPRHEGGPLFWAGKQDSSRLDAAVDRVADAAGPGFRRGDIDALLSPNARQ